LRSSHGPATEHAGRLVDVLVYSHPRISMTGSCIIAVNFIIPWIFYPNNGNHLFVPKEQGINATGATKPSGSHLRTQWLPSHPRTHMLCRPPHKRTCDASRRSLLAPTGSPTRSRGRPRPARLGAASKKARENAWRRSTPLARWFRSAAANTTDAGLSIAVVVVRAPA
jgi:hypothetical protein